MSINLADFWQLNFEVCNAKNTTNSLNYTNRNYELNNKSIFPKISYYYSNEVYISVFYELKNKENQLGDLETLKLQKIGFQTNYANSDTYVLKAEINLFKNKFTGNYNSPAGYQMLEGLQPGNNYTWSLLFSEKLILF